MLTQSITEITTREVYSSFHLEHSFSIIEENIVLLSFHLLIKSSKNKNAKNQYLLLFILLICNISSYNKIKELSTYIRNTFFFFCQDDFHCIFSCLIKYSQFLYNNKEEFYKTRLNNVKKLRDKENKFLQSIIESRDLEFDTETIIFDKFNHHILCRALTIIPYEVTSNNYSQYIKNTIKQIIDYLNREETYDEKSVFAHHDRERLNFNELLSVYCYIADILLLSNIEFSRQIIDILISVPLSATKMQREAEEFIGQILNQMVLKLADEGNVNPDSPLYIMQVNKFWNYWEYLYNILKDKPFNFLSNKLLFDINYLCYDTRGEPYKKQCDLLKGRRNIYGEIVKTFGNKNLLTVINIFTNIGMTSLFPDCITWIVDICKNTESVILVLKTNISTIMVRKLYYQHMTEIVKSDDILNNYIWILDTMIDLGVSEAYFIRENVITYKTTENNKNNEK